MDSGLPLPLFRWRRLAARMRDRREWHDHGVLMGFAATILAVLALSLSQCCRLPGVEVASGIHDAAEGLAYGSSSKRAGADESFSSFGIPVVARQTRISYGIPGGSNGWQHASDPWISRSESSHSRRSHETSAGDCREAIEGRPERREHSVADLGREVGLPTLKADLVRLAVLLHQPVLPKDTVETLKEKIRGPLAAVVATMKDRDSRSRASKDAAAMTSSPPKAAPSSKLATPADRSVGRGSPPAACDPVSGPAISANVHPDDGVHSEPTSDSSRSTSELGSPRPSGATR